MNHLAHGGSEAANAALYSAFDQGAQAALDMSSVMYANHFGSQWRPHPSFVELEQFSSNPLGARAVIWQRASIEAANRGDDTVRTTSAQEAHYELTRVRNFLSDLVFRHGNETASKEGDLLFETSRMPPGLVQLIENSGSNIGGWSENTSLIHKLTTLELGAYPVSDDTLLNLLEWHTERSEALHTQHTTEKIPKYYAELAYTLVRRVVSNELPPIILTRLAAVRDNTRIIADDGSRTVVQGRGGYYTPAEDALYMWDITKQVFDHEITHALEYPRDRSGKISGCSSLESILSEDSPGNRVLKESTVSFIEGLLGGNNLFDTDPANWSLEEGSYPEGRAVIDALCRYGKKAVDIRYFIDALFESKDKQLQRADRSAASKLLATLQDSFPDMDALLATLATLDTKNEDRLQQFANTIKLRTNTPAPWAYDPHFSFTED